MTDTSVPTEVIQADRDAAADLGGYPHQPLMRLGQYDNHPYVQAFARHRLNTRPVASTLDPEVGDLEDADEAAAAARAAGYRPQNPTLWGAAVTGAHVAIARRKAVDPETVEACARLVYSFDPAKFYDRVDGWCFVPWEQAAEDAPLYIERAREIAAQIQRLSPGKTGSAGVGEGEGGDGD